MRNVGIIIMLTLMVLFIACNQNSNTQKSEGTKKSVEEQFAAQFPNATDVEWEHEGEFKEVEFNDNGTIKEIVYNANGEVIETETEISTESLSQEILTYFEENFNNYSFSEAAILENDEGSFYEVEIKIDGKELEFIFDETGEFIKQEIDDDDKKVNEDKE